jgi:hypothetical protein
MAAVPAPTPPSARDSPAPRRRSPAALALGARLARTGMLGNAAFVIGALVTFAGVVIAFVIARQRGYAAPLYDVPSVAATLLGWGPGILLAFAASAQALRRDKDDGIRALLRARGASVPGYVGARVGGLALTHAIVVCGGTLVVGVVSVALAPPGTFGMALHGALAALVYGLAFSLVLPPVAMAALGARSRSGGYVALLGVLVLPEVLARWTAEIVPFEWQGLVSIPGVLAEVRASLMPPAGPDLAKLGRALVVLAVVVGLALVVVRGQAARLEEEDRA